MERKKKVKTKLQDSLKPYRDCEKCTWRTFLGRALKISRWIIIFQALSKMQPDCGV